MSGPTSRPAAGVGSRLRDLAVRLVNLFRRERLERELDAELEGYLALDVEERVRSGMAADSGANRSPVPAQIDH